MKRYGFLFDRICTYENLVAAAEYARKGKSKSLSVRRFYEDFESNIQKLLAELQNGTYQVSEYQHFVKCEPKERFISKLPFQDRVVQWAVILIVEPIWISQFTADAYACIKGRGTHLLKRKLEQKLRRDPEGTRYYLQVDIEKFYHRIDRTILKQVIRKKLKDPKLLALLDHIIDSPEGELGVPIGNFMSQYFANLYLSEFDHLIKE